MHGSKRGQAPLYEAPDQPSVGARPFPATSQKPRGKRKAVARGSGVFFGREVLENRHFPKRPKNLGAADDLTRQLGWV